MQIRNESILVTIDGEVVEGLREHMLSLEVDKKVAAADTFQMKLAISRCDEENDWSYIDDDRFQLFKEIQIELGFEEELEPVFSGYITSVNPNFSSDPSQCTVDLGGVDKTFVMDREHKRRTWENKKDSEIATAIFDENGFQYTMGDSIEDSGEVNDEELVTVVQMDTDMKFLQKLARRNGFEVFIEDDLAYFTSPDYDADPQPVLAAHFGKETTLTNFNPSVDASAPTNINVTMVGRTDRQIYPYNIESTDIPVYGNNSIDTLRGSSVPASVAFIGGNTLSTGAAAQNLGQALYDRQQWFMTASAQVDGNLYGHILHIREPVTIKGVGENYSGEYYVTQVKHSLAPNGYTMDIQLKRNAMQATGNENFESTSDSLLGL